MKFENVNVGDTVYTERQVRYGWQSAETFFVPEKVTRTTKTQFVVENGDRYKKDGRKIGDTWVQAYFKGDKHGYSNNRTICDESSKMKMFKLKLSLERQINKKVESIKITTNSDIDYHDLLMIDKLVDGVISKIKITE